MIQQQYYVTLNPYNVILFTTFIAQINTSNSKATQGKNKTDQSNIK